VSGNYVIIVRAKNNSVAGTCDLYRDGALLRQGVMFAGWIVTFHALRSMEDIETVRMPNGPPEAHRLYLLRPDRVGMFKRIASGGAAGGTRYTVPSPASTLTVVAGALNSATPGPARIVRNDAALTRHDPDGDGLGSELESQLGTCSRPTGTVKGFNCSLATDARDTDGDGISDAWEVLGRRDVQPHQPLPLWGADPRHKDLFMEVDFMLRRTGELAQRMQPNQARQFARFFQDEIGTLTPEQRTAHAASLRNPDGQPGIRVHLDTGVPPATPADATLYGDWGGYTAVPPVQDGVGADYTQAWKTHMTLARRGIFRYMFPNASGAGQVGPGYACTSGLDHIPTLAHECGHALGLWSHSLEPHGSPDTNCKPNHPSVIDYAYGDGSVGFADGTGRAPLNNAFLTEWQAVPASSTQYLADLRDRFGYYVDLANGHVDWDRSGSFEAAGRHVRAYANFHPGGSCEYTRYNQVQVEGAQSDRAPAVARLGNRIYAFWVDQASRRVRYRFSTSAWNCSTPGPPCGSWDGGGIATTSEMGEIAGIDAARLGNRLVLISLAKAGGPLTKFSVLWQRELTVSAAGVESWTAPQNLGTTTAAGEPALDSDSSRLLLVYKLADGRLKYRMRGLDQPWSEEQAVTTSGGVELATWAHASPGIGQATLRWPPGPGATYRSGFYGAFADASGVLGLWYFDLPNGRWEDTHLISTSPAVEGRPALGWTPHAYCCNSVGGWIVGGLPGKFYLIYTIHGTDYPRRTRMMISYTSVSPGGNIQLMLPRVGLDSDYDNVWWTADGIDLLPDYINSGSFFVLATLAAYKQVWLRPRSDGLLNYEYNNKDDWAILRKGLCYYLVNTEIGPLGLQPPIRCPQP
jgi:hypothetical protein